MPIKTAFLSSALALTAGSAAMAEMNFNRVASFPTFTNMADGEDKSRETSAEIISVTADGNTLVYSDSPLGVIGRIDITDPANPLPLGNIALDGEPTAVSALGGTVFVGINTSESYTAPSGHLAHYVVETGELAADCDLGGQPDSTAVAPDGSFVAVAIENERDEDLGEGRVPQMPAGYVSIIPLDSDGMMQCDAQIQADITGLANIAPEDPEPEFVDVNAAGEIAVTLQENNHIVVLNAAGEVLSHFSAGAVTLEGVDITEEGALTFTDSLVDVPREPDALQWIDQDRLVTANEGDMDGGSRGFTVFHKDGTEIFESGLSFERALIEIGHYPEERSGNKGVEPEGMEFAVIDGTPTLFLLSERGSIVGVYDMTDPAAPVLTQLLPSGIAPEGAVAIPGRNLLAIANEADDAGPRSHVMIFEYQDAAPIYPQLTSAGADELIGWGAISGMVAGGDGIVYAVNDSFYAMQPSIFTIDTTKTPARITDVTRITRNGQSAQKLDLEGIALDGEGGFWLASEGRENRLRPHAVFHVGADGEIQDEIAYPDVLQDVARRHAAEGITRVGDILWIAIQREWDNDPENHAKVVSYNTATEEWGAVHYPLMEVDSGWAGLSEITAHGGWMYFVERDNQFSNSAIKAVTRVSMDQMVPAPLGSKLPVLEKEMVRDLRNDLTGFNGYIQDKVEGMAIFEDGTTWISTDNDGVDDNSGETFFFSIGQM